MTVISSLNIGGLLSPIKQQSFVRSLHSNRIEMALVQETNQTEGVNFDVLNHDKTYTTFCSPGSHRGSGIMFIVSNSLYVSDIIHTEVYPGHAAILSFRSNEYVFCFVNVYLPHDQTIAVTVLSAIQHCLQGL